MSFEIGFSVGVRVTCVKLVRLVMGVGEGGDKGCGGEDGEDEGLAEQHIGGV